MTPERLLFVIESAAMHFGDGAARAALRMLSFELRNEIKREQEHVRNNKVSIGEDEETRQRETGTR